MGWPDYFRFRSRTPARKRKATKPFSLLLVRHNFSDGGWTRGFRLFRGRRSFSAFLRVSAVKNLSPYSCQFLRFVSLIPCFLSSFPSCVLLPTRHSTLDPFFLRKTLH